MIFPDKAVPFIERNCTVPPDIAPSSADARAVRIFGIVGGFEGAGEVISPEGELETPHSHPHQHALSERIDAIQSDLFWSKNNPRFLLVSEWGGSGTLEPWLGFLSIGKMIKNKREEFEDVICICF
jgi:hypothetical protein